MSELLTEAINLAHTDWRDLIMYTEYKKGQQVRLLTIPFGICPDCSILKQWIIGQQILIPWATQGDEKWTIAHSDIREFSVLEMESQENKAVSKSGFYQVRVGMLCVYGPDQISVSRAMNINGFICYRSHPKTGEFLFEKFWYRPESVRKRGKW